MNPAKANAKNSSKGSSTLYLIRHAQSRNNASRESERVCDPEITDIGRQQGRSLGEFFATRKFESLICSAFRRALQTAQFIGDATQKESEVVVDLHEHGGCYDGWNEENIQGRPGLDPDQIRAEFGDVVCPPELQSKGWWQSKPRESHEQSDQRAERMAQVLRDRLSVARSDIVCITHADFLSKLLLAMFGDEINALPEFFDLKNVGITKVGLVNSDWKLYQLNAVDFLTADLVTS